MPRSLYRGLPGDPATQPEDIRHIRCYCRGINALEVYDVTFTGASRRHQGVIPGVIGDLAVSTEARTGRALLLAAPCRRDIDTRPLT